MNPLTNVKNITKLNETELASGSIHKKSWHDMYKESAWIFVGGLEYGLTEGDVLAVFSQYGEIMNINLIRDKKTGKSKGYCFLCYANQNSTVLAVDNFNGIKLCHRTIRVDHVANYKPPKENERDDEITKLLKNEGCAPQVVQKIGSKTSEDKAQKKKSKKEKKEKKKKRKKDRSKSGDLKMETSSVEDVKVKKEKHDTGYDKYDTAPSLSHRSSSLDNSRRDSSDLRENGRSKEGRPHFKTKKDDDRGRLSIKREPESDSDARPSTSSQRRKRKRSSSSSDKQTNRHQQSRSHKKDKNESHRPSDPKRRYGDHQDSSSSSSDNGSSTQSSSEEEDHRNSRNDSSKTHSRLGSYRDNSRERNYSQSKKSYASNKNRYERAEKHSEHKSRTKYRSDDSDDDQKNSHYHKSKSKK